MCGVQVAGIRVHPAQLVGRHRTDAGMGVADMGDVVVGIQIGPPPLVEQVVLPAAQEHHRLLVGQFQVPGEMGVAVGQQIGFRFGREGQMRVGQVQERGGVGKARHLKFARIGVSHAVPVGIVCETQLQMQMRRPATVFGQIADMGEGLARRDPLPRFQAGAPGGQMAPERVEATCLRVMAQDDHPAIALRAVLDPGPDDPAVKGGMQRCPRRGEQVNPKVDGAAGRAFGRAGEGGFGIDQPRLAITAKPAGIGPAQPCRLAGGQGKGVFGTKAAADRKIADRKARDVIGNDRGECPAHGIEPAKDRGRLRHDRQAAGEPQPGEDPRRVKVTPFQKPPGRGLRDRHIGIVRAPGRLDRRIHHADRKPHADQRPEKREVTLPHRAGPVIARDQRGQRRLGIIAVEYGVGRKDGEVGHHRGAGHVAKVDQPGDGGWRGDPLTDQDVPVVQVIVDRLPGQGVKRGAQGIERGKDALHQRAAGAGKDMQMVLDPTRLGQLPFLCAVQERVIETAQSPRQSARHGPEIVQERKRRFHHLGKGPAGQRALRPAKALRPGIVGKRERRADDGGQRQIRVHGPRMVDGADLHPHQRGIAAVAHDLQDDRPVIVRGAEIQVVFATEAFRFGTQAEVIDRRFQPVHPMLLRWPRGPCRTYHP